MRLTQLCAVVLLLAAPVVCWAGNSIVPTTTLAAETSNNTSAAPSFSSQSNGNRGSGNVSRLDVHTLLSSGLKTKVYAHLMLWFGKSNHMNVGYSSTDPAQVHRQITDMISRGIDGVIIDWYGSNSFEDQATQVVMAEAESHPGFTFAIMVDQGAIKWDSCSGCSPQQALLSQLQYIEQKYFPSPAYMTDQGRPVVTNFDIDLAYSIDWNALNAALSTHPLFLFQNNSGFTHVLSGGSYSWVMPTAPDYGLSYLASFYGAGLSSGEQVVGAAYKGFNDSLAAWGSHRIMGQQCGQTWLKTFSEINRLYNSTRSLPALQLVTWNDYEEGSEIESGIDNCFSVSAAVSGTSLHWTPRGDESTVDHYQLYISSDGQNLMPLANMAAGLRSVNLCSYSMPVGNYVLYVQAVAKPSMANQISSPASFPSNRCASSSSPGTSTLSLGVAPSSLAIAAGRSGSLNVTVAVQSGSFNNPVALSCSPVSGLSCSFSPAAVTPGSGTAKSTLTVSALVATGANQPHRRSLPVYATFLFFFGLPGLVLAGNIRRRAMIQKAAVCTLMAIILILICASCGGNPAPAQVRGVAATPGAYSVTINGISGSTQLATTVTVTVQ
jgi:hypothetical protein